MAIILFRNEKGEFEEIKASKLENPVKINGTPFDGSEDIDISEIEISKKKPTNPSVKLWGRVLVNYPDVVILREIRNANPTSYLSTLFSDDKDPLLEWYDENQGVGAMFGKNPLLEMVIQGTDIVLPPIDQRDEFRVYALLLPGMGPDNNISVMNNLDKLERLSYLYIPVNSITNINVSNMPDLQALLCDGCGLGNPVNINFDSSHNIKLLSVSNCMLQNLSVIILSGLLELNCSTNLISYLELSHLYSLKKLICDNNLLTSLNVFDLTSLELLSCSGNKLTSFDSSGIYNIKQLNIGSNAITNINIDSLGNLELMNFSYNNGDVDLNVSANIKLTSLSCEMSKITSLTLNNPLLTTLYCSNNKLTSIDIQKTKKLQRFKCNGNQLTSLIFTGIVDLIELNCSSNQITELTDIENCLSLSRFACTSNKLIALNTLPLIKLTSFDCSFNGIETLNFSNATLLGNITCRNNKLTSLTLQGDTKNLTILYVNNNKLTGIPTLTKQGRINSYDFKYNNLNTTELNRYRSMGFINESMLLPQNP